MSRSLLSINDLDVPGLTALFSRAGELRAGAPPAGPSRNLGLLFFETSLRTRTGFLAAAQRLGWPAPVEVMELRSSAVSMPESIGDTAAVLGAYFDTLIVRLDRPIGVFVPHVGREVTVVNAGDRGPAAEHPTQALIDVFAMETLVGRLSDLRVALCGDLRMRAARSLLKLMAAYPPAELVLVTDPSLTDGLELPEGLDCRMTESLDDLSGIDALHALGIPHGAAAEDVRTRLRIDVSALACLGERGRVFSPMPVIDEVAEVVRADERVAFLAQSAMAIHVRMAVLESL